MVSGGFDKLLKTIFCCSEKNILTFPTAELLYIYQVANNFIENSEILEEK